VVLLAKVKKGSTVVLVGTKKGGFVFHSPDRRRWSVLGPYAAGLPVYHMILDPRDGRTVYAGALTPGEVWGPGLYRGRLGNAPAPTKSAPAFREGSDLAVTRLWHLEPGPSDSPRSLLVGVEPAALFRTDDGGDTWSGYDALNYYPGRKDWQPGFGGLCAHSVLLDPRDSRHLLVGISAVGTFETKDDGTTWQPENGNVRADFLPNKYPETGQCVHHLVWDSAGDGSVFHQNHCGTYYRGSEGGAWTEITKGLPSDFGFAIVAHPHEKHTAYVAPLIGGANRVPPKSQLAVWKTSNRGRSWKRLTKGLPGPGAYMGVLREGMAADAADPVGLYLGTNTGHLYASRDEGASWKPIVTSLPPILSVSTGVAR
jgi:hypothetical protein